MTQNLETAKKRLREARAAIFVETGSDNTTEQQEALESIQELLNKVEELINGYPDAKS